MGKNFFSIIIVILFSLIAGISLFHKGLLPTHDGEYHVVRFFLFDEALRDGNLYPRWAAHLNNNFGVPLFTFVYPLPNYIASFFHSLGVSFIDSFKLEMIIAVLTGGVFFYLWSREFWGKLGGIVSSVFYTFSPYHFVDIYIRGSIGEVWALAFFPAFLWSFTKLVKTKRKTFLLLSSLFLALIIFSHNILALMFFLFALSYVVLLIFKETSKKNLVLNSILAILLGLGLSAVFWLPAIYETKYVTGLQIFDVTSHFPDLYQLLIPTWGSGFSGAGLQDELSFQIGIANLFVIFLSFIVIVIQIMRKRMSVYTVFFLICSIFVFLLMLDISKFVWQVIPLMNYFQFPWRLLSLEILFTSFLAGSIFSLNIKNRFINLFFAFFLIFTSFILGIGYAKPAYYMDRGDNYYFTKSNFMDGTNSIGNVFNTISLKTIPKKEKEIAEFLGGDGKIFPALSKSSRHVLKIIADKNSEIIMNLPSYPGWEVYINKRKQKIMQTKDGRFSFEVPVGESLVEVKFEDTSMRKIAGMISLFSVVILFTLFIKYKSSKI